MRKRRKSEEASSGAGTKDAVQKFIQNGLLKKSNIVMKHSHIRVMVFAEKANRLRFDSDTIKLATEDPTETNMTRSPCGRLMFAPQKADIKVIGDYIFGDAQHMLEAGGCKIHKNVSGRVMVSRIFALPRERDMGNINFNIESEVRTAVQLWNSYLNQATTSKSATSRSSYFDTEPPEYIRRISKSRKLTFSRIPLQSSDCTVSYGSSHRLGSTIKSLNVVRLIAISVLFDSDFSEFIIENLHFIDREMRNLQHQLFEALCGDKNQFYWNAATASYDFRLNIISFHNAFRLGRIVSHIRDPPSAEFYSLFSEVIANFETKDCGYFLSRLISAILMFHLSWVSTTNEAYYDRITDFWTKSEFLESRTKPFLTILGCIGMLSHTTRIVITGKNLDNVAKLLEVIPYFLRFHRISGNTIKKPLFKGLNFSPNNIWSFRKAEILVRMNTNKEKPTDMENLEVVADRWQLGECPALFAQKTILRESHTGNPWTVRFNHSFFGARSMRSRARSEPQKSNSDEALAVDFRRRSTSNPVTKFTSPASKDFEKDTAKDYYPDPNEFTRATGKLPYGFSIPKYCGDRYTDNEDDDPVAIMRKYEYQEASRVWGKIKEPTLSELLSLKTQLMNIDNEGEMISSQTHQSVMSPISSEEIYETRPGSSKDPYRQVSSRTVTDEPCSSSSSREQYYSPAKSPSGDIVPDISDQNLASIEKCDTPGLPYWKRNRKSSTALARALANNAIDFNDPLNPEEIEEIYEEKLNDIHYTETTIDKYVESFLESTDLGIEGLFGGINGKFEPAFVLQGIDGNVTGFKELKDLVRKEVRHPESFYIAVPKDEDKDESKATLRSKGRNNGETKELEFIQMTSVYIVANVDLGEISIISGDLQTLKEEEMVYPSDSVLSMLDKLRELCAIKAAPHIMTKLVENSLDDLVRKGSLLQQVIEFADQDSTDSEVPFNPSAYVQNGCHAKLISEISRRHREQQQVVTSQEKTPETSKEEKIDAGAIVKLLDCHYSDLRLLINICSILSPAVRSSVWPTNP
ncbi:hypothetical protein FO519_001911 [Halicephalobus sp. NKZ332]|nr:hypothetical protein FO519_001911 [Halicephalobus sp. NKZ332]